MSLDAVKNFLDPEVLQRYKTPPQQPSEEQSTAAPITAATTASDTSEQQDTVGVTTPSTDAQETSSN